MNRKQRRMAQAQGSFKPAVQIQGKSYTVEEASTLAIQEHGRRNIQGAMGVYQLILATDPNHADTYNNQSIILHEMGRYQDALASCNKAIALAPDCAMFYFNRGNTLQALKRYAEALADYDKAAAAKSGHPPLYNNRAITLNEMKRYDEALASYAQAIALRADYVAAYYNMGVTLQTLNRNDEALASYDKVIALDPAHVNAHSNRGTLLQIMKRYDEALAACDKAIALSPNFALLYYNRAVTLRELKRYDKALASYDQAVALDPAYADAYNNRGALLQELKHYDEALASLQKAVACRPDYADAYNNMGVILMNKGNMAEAEKMFLKSLELKPDFAVPLFSLIDMHKYKDADHPHVKLIRSSLDKAGASFPYKEYLYFSLGKIYDDCGRYDEAFECYRLANEIINKDVSYNHAATVAMTNNLFEVFTKEFLAQPFPFASASRSPIFVVGMPRSGTTLMSSILSNHPSVAAAGELTTMIELTQSLPHYPYAAKSITPDAATRLMQEYEARLRRDIGADITHIVDKHPINYRHLGFIAKLFPHAKIIHCTRHPLDTCLSNYFQRFAPDYDYSFDLSNIGHFYNEYDRLMEHWRKVLPGTMIDISYEDMIMNTEPAARRALDFIGLEWNERCLTPHTNTYVVETASRWQVRQPIYTQSVERWRHYDKHLGPLKGILHLSGEGN